MYWPKLISFCATVGCAALTNFADAPGDVTQGATSKSNDSQQSIQATKLIGSTVTSKGGESLGKVQDLIIDMDTGEIQYALVGKGFMAGLGEQVIPVPWQATHLQAQKEFVLSVDRPDFNKAPSWEESQTKQPEYTVRIYRYFEIEPKEAVGGSGSAGTESGTGTGSGKSATSQEDKSDSSSSNAKPEHHHENSSTPDK